MLIDQNSGILPSEKMECMKLVSYLLHWDTCSIIYLKCLIFVIQDISHPTWLLCLPVKQCAHILNKYQVAKSANILKEKNLEPEIIFTTFPVS